LKPLTGLSDCPSLKGVKGIGAGLAAVISPGISAILMVSVAGGVSGLGTGLCGRTVAVTSAHNRKSSALKPNRAMCLCAKK
jgi:hypothetical protein